MNPEITRKLSGLEQDFDKLKDVMAMYQSNIDNNITWFYTVVGIIVALIGAVAVALYFLVKSSVKAGVEKGIKDVTSVVQKEINDLRSEINSIKETQDEKIISILKENPQIKWATGTITSYGIDRKGRDGITQMPFFQGEIDWDSPLNRFEIKLRNGSSVNYKIIKKYPEGMDILIYDVPKDLVEYEWKFIWVIK